MKKTIIRVRLTGMNKVLFTSLFIVSSLFADAEMKTNAMDSSSKDLSIDASTLPKDQEHIYHMLSPLYKRVYVYALNTSQREIVVIYEKRGKSPYAAIDSILNKDRKKSDKHYYAYQSKAEATRRNESRKAYSKSQSNSQPFVMSRGHSDKYAPRSAQKMQTQQKTSQTPQSCNIPCKRYEKTFPQYTSCEKAKEPQVVANSSSYEEKKGNEETNMEEQDSCGFSCAPAKVKKDVTYDGKTTMRPEKSNVPRKERSCKSFCNRKQIERKAERMQQQVQEKPTKKTRKASKAVKPAPIDSCKECKSVYCERKAKKGGCFSFCKSASCKKRATRCNSCKSMYCSKSKDEKGNCRAQKKSKEQEYKQVKGYKKYKQPSYRCKNCSHCK